MTYVCKRTGETFATQGVAESIHGIGYCDNVNPVAAIQAAIAIPPSDSSPGGMDTRARDASGNLITNQIGSQFWMDASAVKTNEYSENDPSLAVKQVFSSADYSRDWITAYAQTLAASGADLSGAVGKIAADNPAPSAVTKSIWDLFPEITPAAAYDARTVENTATSPQAQGGSSVTTPTSSAANPSIITGAVTKVGGLISSTGAIMLAIAVIVIVGAWYLLKGSSSHAGVPT
jgi:hypothetical protein